MIKYTSTSGKKSGVLAYEIGDDYIMVQFPEGFYKYSYDSCGESATEEMKELASTSCGLSTYIAQIQPDFEWKQ